MEKVPIKWSAEKRKISQLIPAEYNPRELTDKQYKDLSISLQRFNLADPIIINKNNTIIGGHQRIAILRNSGDLEIDVRVPSRELTAKEEKELNLRLNKNLGQWNIDALGLVDESLLKEVGFTSQELDDIFGGSNGGEDDIPKQRETDIKAGDMFQLGDHRLLCGDATNNQDVQKLIGTDKIQLVFTSPPYNMAGNLYQNYEDNLAREEYINLHLRVIKIARPFLKGFVFWNVSYNKNARDEFLEIMYRIVKETGLRFLEMIVWDKGHALPVVSKQGLTRQYEDILLVGDPDSIQQDLEIYCIATSEKRAFFNKRTHKGITNYWRISTNNTQIEGHQACFPVALPSKGIELMTERGAITYDPFAGSGSTLIACEKLARKCRAIELDPMYCQLIIDRYEKYTNNKVQKVEN